MRLIGPIERAFACIGLVVLGVACSVGPDYRRPTAPVPTVYKEFKGWKVAAPNDTINRGAWWSIYRDPTLDALERKIDISNQNLKQSEAVFREARAVVREQQSSFFPSLTATPQVERQKSGGGTAITSYSLEGTATWEPDVWGKIRRSVESSVAGAQVSAAQLAAARLSAQAQLATDYFQLRFADSLRHLLDATVKAYQRSLQITENQYAAGTAARSDVINAQAQLLAAQAAAINVGVQRAQNEHAIALLVGKPPAEVSIPPGSLPERVPIVPTSVPSTLLERRPDIAEAERQMQEENALIGVQLAAFQNVEDELASLRVLGQQNGVQQAAVQAAQRAVEITLNEYQAGTVAYTIVITAQATLLTDQENALQVQEGRLIASVALVQALGGGWDTSQLPTHHQLEKLHLIPD
jgi:NodT family efflux transporter outer membrane factor (OMF) lipoprotein